MTTLLAMAAALLLSAPAGQKTDKDKPNDDSSEAQTVPTESPAGKALQTGARPDAGVAAGKNPASGKSPEQSQAVSDPSGSANDSSKKHESTAKPKPPGSDSSGSTESPK
jgi:hypothetical protein